MERTRLITKIVGPVLLLRSVSILLDRSHFVSMLRGLDAEVATITFSFFPIALLMVCIGLAVVHTDTSSPAAMLIRFMAWGGIAKGTALILAPHAVVAKAHLLEQAGFLNVVLVVTASVGAYFTWFGFLRRPGWREPAAPHP